MRFKYSFIKPHSGALLPSTIGLYYPDNGKPANREYFC